MQDVLTTDNFPMCLLGKLLEEKEFQYLDGVELIKGKSIVVNKAGMCWLYMSDDHRKEEPKQIIVKKIGGFEMAFLSTECKIAIKLNNYKYV